MAGQNPNMDQFEAYFKRADLDGDGRISGAEAVGFFQGSGLSKQVLAQVNISSWISLLSDCFSLERSDFVFYAADLGFQNAVILIVPFELHSISEILNCL
jgi:hypothetical protein